MNIYSKPAFDPDWSLAWRSYAYDPHTFDTAWLAHYAVSVIAGVRLG